MRKTAPSITNLPPSPAQDRHRRVVEYTTMMVIRCLCLVICVVLAAVHIPLWWELLPALGAVFLPYFAVVTANAVKGGMPGNDPERPGQATLESYEQLREREHQL